MGNFDDEFDVALTFNSPGLLAMANPGAANSNTSEIFITDIDLPLADQPQYLNFRHTIFGQLTSGFELYQEIMNAQGVSSSNSSPTSPVTITSATIINDTQNGVVQISQPVDFSGTATITVMATSTDGSTSQQTFTVNVVAPSIASAGQPLLLLPVDDQVTDLNKSISFEISASEYYSGDLTFSVTGSNGFYGVLSNVTAVVTAIDSLTALVTLTPAAGFTGTIELLVHVDDTAQGLHDAQTLSLTVVAPVEIVSVSDPINSQNAGNLTVSGTGQAGAAISLIANDGNSGTVAYTTTVSSDGTWTIAGVDVSGLADGSITFRVTSTDSDGDPVEDSLSATKDTTPPSLSVAAVTDPINAASSSAVSAAGSGEVGATISVVVSDGSNFSATYTATVDSSGNWSIAGIDVSTLDDGTLTFTITATDAAGNVTETSTSAVKDTVAPEVSLTTVTDPVVIDNSDTVSASGTGEVGDHDSVVITDGVHSTVAVTTTVGNDGTWSVSGIDVSPLNDGQITYVATATDAAGNSSQSSLVASKDTVAITVVTDPVNAANAANTSVGGTGAVGATISLVVSDGIATTDAYTTTVSEAGTWSIDGIDVSDLADGPITFTATATNTAGNSAHSSKSVVKDTVPPTSGSLNASNPINLSNQTAAFVNGSTEAGATVSVAASDGTSSTDSLSTTAGEFGTWSISDIDVSGLLDGVITFTVTITDAAGKTAQFTTTANKDTIAPDVAITAVTDPVDIVSHNLVTVSGTGEVGASISVTVSDGLHSVSSAVATVGTDGTWSIGGIDVSELLDGTITYTATATDAGFNTAQQSMTATKTTVSITLFTGPINLGNVLNVSVSGTGQIGATVTVVVSDGTNSTSPLTTTIGADGTWSISGIDASLLNDGTITFTTTAADDVGNSVQTSATTTKNTVAPAVEITFVTDPIVDANAASVSASGTGDVGDWLC